MSLLLLSFGMDHDKMVGLAYWGSYRVLGNRTGYRRKAGTFLSSIIVWNLIRKAYLIKSAFCEEPLVHIGVMDNGKEAIEWNDIMVGSLSLASH